MEFKFINEDMPNKPFLSIDEVVANASSIIKGADINDQNLFRQWAWLGERQIGFGGLNEETADIPVSDLSIKKPVDYAAPIDIALYTSEDEGPYTELLWQYHGGKRRIHAKPSTKRYVDLSEDPYFFNLSSDYGNSVVKAKLRYYAYPIDSKGYPAFPEIHLFAIMMFVRYMWAIRENNSRSEIAEAKEHWEQAKVIARNRTKMPHMLKGQQIMRDWRSMIDKANYRRF